MTTREATIIKYGGEELATIYIKDDGACWYLTMRFWYQPPEVRILPLVLEVEACPTIEDAVSVYVKSVNEYYSI